MNDATESLDLDLDDVTARAGAAMRELLDIASVPQGGLVVLGASSSEIRGGHIGKAGSAEVGEAVIAGIRPVVAERGVHLAVQGCEHINRSLVVEREYARAERLEVVTVVPALQAGGAVCRAAYDAATDPVMVEHVVADAGLDIGDTEVGSGDIVLGDEHGILILPPAGINPFVLADALAADAAEPALLDEIAAGRPLHEVLRLPSG